MMLSTKRRVLKTREYTQTLLSRLVEKEYCPAKNKNTANIYPKVTAFLPKRGGLRWGTALNKPLTTNILSFRGVNINSFDSIISRLLSFREAKPRRISKTISESYLLGFIKLTGKMLKQVQHDFLFMEGLLCYP